MIKLFVRRLEVGSRSKKETLMKYLIIAGLVVMACIFFVRCKTNTKSQTTTSSSSTSKESTPLFYLKKGACRGACKVYEFSVDASGSAYLKGKRNIEHIGEFTTILNERELASLKEMLNRKNFPALDQEYPLIVKDMQQYTMQYKETTLKFQKRNGPRDLFPVLDEIDQLIAKLDWKAITAEK